MINSVSKITPSFRGEEKVEQADNKQKAPSVAEIQEKADEFARGVEATAEGIKDVSESVTGAVATTAGSVGMIGAAISKIIPQGIKDFFSKSVPLLDEAGNKVIENGKVVMKNVADWKKIGIAGAIITGVTVLGLTIAQLIKNNKEKQETKNQEVDNASYSTTA